jgi:molybdate transport system substrate-binding protein
LIFIHRVTVTGAFFKAFHCDLCGFTLKQFFGINQTIAGDTIMAQAGEIKIMLGIAFKEALLAIAPVFERTSGNKVVPLWLAGPQMLPRLQSGESVDIVISSAANIDNFIKLGVVAPGSRVDLVKSRIGAAVRAGAPKPDISSADALKRTLLAAKSVAYSVGPSGIYLYDWFKRMAILDALKPKLIKVEAGPTAALVARGEAELCFQQMSELMPVAGIDIIGPLSADVQQITVFSSGIGVRAEHVDAARALIQFAKSPGVTTAIKNTGLEQIP